MSCTAYSVESFALNPNWHGENKLYLSKKSITAVAIIFSKIFPIEGNNDIGRYESGLSLTPPLKRGITSAILNESGKTPCARQRLNK